MGRIAAPFLAKSAHGSARAGFLTFGLRCLPQKLAAIYRKKLWRCSACLSGPSRPVASSKKRPVGIACQQRRPITVAGPWPIFTAFHDPGTANAEGFNALDYFVSLFADFPASRLNFTKSSVCATANRVNQEASREEIGTSVSDSSIAESAFPRWRAGLHWNPRDPKAR